MLKYEVGERNIHLEKEERKKNTRNKQCFVRWCTVKASSLLIYISPFACAIPQVGA